MLRGKAFLFVSMHHESWELVKGTVSKFQVSKLCYLHVVFSCRAAWWNCTILPATWPVPQLRSVLFWLLTQWRRSMARKLNEGWSWFFSYFLCFCKANKITMWYIVMGKMRFHAFKCRSANIHVTRCNVFRFFWQIDLLQRFTSRTFNFAFSNIC